MHTLLSHAHQPFVYSDYTIFIAEVPSTLSEALFLEYMLDRAKDDRERIVLLQHAIDGIVGTFYTQVLFADYELRAHRLVEQDQPITAEVLTELYTQLLTDYYGDAVDLNPLTGITWARIPHFFNSPYYVYQYATCFASAARIAERLMRGTPQEQADARDRFLTLLRSGGSDHPMALLKKAGIDLSEPDTVRAIVNQLDDLAEIGLRCRRSTDELTLIPDSTGQGFRLSMAFSSRVTSASSCSTTARTGSG
jgi:oligoendopeptidase F